MTLSGTVAEAAAMTGEVTEAPAIGGGLSSSAALGGEIGFWRGSEDCVVFSSHLEFPNLGNARKLYVATDEAATYFFDTVTSSYICCGSDCGAINKIISGLNEEEDI